MVTFGPLFFNAVCSSASVVAMNTRFDLFLRGKGEGIVLTYNRPRRPRGGIEV